MLTLLHLIRYFKKMWISLKRERKLLSKLKYPSNSSFYPCVRKFFSLCFIFFSHFSITPCFSSSSIASFETLGSTESITSFDGEKYEFSIPGETRYYFRMIPMNIALIEQYKAYCNQQIEKFNADKTAIKTELAKRLERWLSAPQKLSLETTQFLHAVNNESFEQMKSYSVGTSAEKTEVLEKIANELGEEKEEICNTCLLTMRIATDSETISVVNDFLENLLTFSQVESGANDSWVACIVRKSDEKLVMLVNVISAVGSPVTHHVGIFKTFEGSTWIECPRHLSIKLHELAAYFMYTMRKSDIGSCFTLVFPRAIMDQILIKEFGDKLMDAKAMKIHSTHVQIIIELPEKSSFSISSEEPQNRWLESIMMGNGNGYAISLPFMIEKLGTFTLKPLISPDAAM